METLTINQRQAAALMDLTPRRMRQLDSETDDPPPRDQAGLYPCEDFGRWMRDQWRKSVGFAEDGTAYDYDQEKARLTHHQANAAAQEDQRKRGELIPAYQVEQAWSDMVASARTRLLALPSRVASACSGKNAEDIEVLARDIITEALLQLSGGAQDKH